jgi:transposase
MPLEICKLSRSTRSTICKEEYQSSPDKGYCATQKMFYLLEYGITHVAMESTGVYWKTVYHILEPAGLTAWVVNARHIKYVPGHKTDKKDSAWLCKLLLASLLKPSYIPARE